MKRRISPVISLWILLLVALVIFIGLSLSDDIKIGNYTLSKAYFPETILAKQQTEEVEKEKTDSLDLETIETEVIEPDTTVHSVLIFGDSMTHNLGMSIAKYGKKNNYKITSVTWESSSIPKWSNSGKIKEYFESSKPDFVIVSLGANEMELKHFERRVPDIKSIVEQIGDTPFVWVGPPLWKEDRGVYKMLEEALPDGVLFKVDNLDIERGPDKIHPTRKGADMWADTLMRWISRSSHPILTEVPDSGTDIKGNKFVYLHPDD